MDEQTMLRNHALFQKSWTGWQCDHKADHPAPSQSEGLPKRSKTTKKLPPSAKRTSKLKTTEPPVVYVTVDPLSYRRNQRADRVKPRSETPPKATKSDHVELHYEAFLPKNRWVEYRTRQYVTNPRYGQLYEVRKEGPAPKQKEEPNSWLWEQQFRLWRMEVGRPEPPRSKVDAARIRDLPKGNISLRTSNQTKKSEAKPHADLFAAYHNQQLINQRRNVAAIVIQRHVRGWHVRTRIARMKHHALLALGRSWPCVTQEYRETVTRIQARNGMMRTSCPFTLDDMEDYLQKREKYERIFERVAIGDKLSRDQLAEFLAECGHYPTEADINAAFNAVFRGSGATAEVVFVLDCSTSLGIVGFHDQMTFAKDVVRTLDVAPDRVRVGVVPYNTDVFQPFGLLQHSSKQEVIDAIDKIRFQPGLTHTGLALQITRDVFKDARPGVQKVAIVVTDGQSNDRQQTALQAKKAADDNITIFAIARDFDQLRALLVREKFEFMTGSVHDSYREVDLSLRGVSLETRKLSGVGNNVDKTELEEIAGDTSRVFMCSDYHALQSLKHLINNKLCLRACTLCQHILPRVQLHGLYKSEALDIILTLYPPPNAKRLSSQEASSDRPVPRNNREQFPAIPSEAEEHKTSESLTARPFPEISCVLEVLRLELPLQIKAVNLFSPISPSTQLSGGRYMTREVNTNQIQDVSQRLPMLTKPSNNSLCHTTPSAQLRGGRCVAKRDKAIENIHSTCPPKGVRSPPPSPAQDQITKKVTADEIPPDERVTSVDGSSGGKQTSSGPNSNGQVTTTGSQLSGEEGQTDTLTEARPDGMKKERKRQKKRSKKNKSETSGKSTEDAGERLTEFRLKNASASFTGQAYYSLEEISVSDGQNSNRSQVSSEVGTDTPSDSAEKSSDSPSTTGDNSTSVSSSDDDEDDSDDDNGDDTERRAESSDVETGIASQTSVTNNGRQTSRAKARDVCRPLSVTEALDVVWTLYPLPATGLAKKRSRWIRPIVDGVEAWSLLDEKIIKATDFKVCLGLVVKSKLERDGVISIPSDVRAGVEEATTYEEAMEKIEEYIEKRKKEGRPLPIPK